MKISFLLAASLSFVLIGCGGGGSSNTTNTSSASTTSAMSSSSTATTQSSSSSSSNEISSTPSSATISSSESSSSSVSSSSESSSSVSSSSSSSSSSTATETSLILSEPFSVDKDTLFSAGYKSVSTNAATPFFYVTGGATGITQADGILTLAGGRFSMGNRTPETSTSSAAVNGDLDLSKPYVIRIKIASGLGSGNFQVYIDNNTTSAGNSPLGSASKVYAKVASTLTANSWIEITPGIGSTNSFIVLRSESAATVTIDEVIVEYLPSDGTSSTSSSSSAQVTSSSTANSTSSTASLSSSAPSSASVSSSSSSLAIVDVSEISADCIALATDPAVNWRDTSLQSDQDIVECLSTTLGRAVGYGENARGGYDANGNSHLVVITKGGEITPEQQVLNAISSADYNWIVFDKVDYANGGDIAMYRLYCSSAAVLADLDNATTAECLDHNLWCANHNVSSADCAANFYNDHLDDANLPIRNPMIESNTTIDGRGSNARFLFSGFKIGADDSGTVTHTSQNVVLTHLLFEGAGHAEDHHLDPDMIRSTGASHDIWIHQNTFKMTGDSAFDVKMGAYGITMSFNRLEDVLRASLHGSSDSRTINSQIRTTMHNNFFITSDEFYNGPHAGNNTARRVPLIRRGSSHMYNNVFYNYRKNFASVRVGATLFLENNIFLGGTVIQEEKSTLASSFSEWLTYLTKDDFDGGNFASVHGMVTYADDKCQIDNTYQGEITAAIGGDARDLKADYSQTSRDKISATSFAPGQDLVDYTNITAGRDGQLPFNSPLAVSPATLISQGKATCL